MRTSTQNEPLTDAEFDRLGDFLKSCKDIGRVLTPEQELKLFSVASTRREWTVAFWVSLIAANTTAGGCEIRNLRLRDIDIGTKTLCVRVGKNKFRVRAIPLNLTAMWAVERLVDRAHKLGATEPEHYLIPRRIAGSSTIPRIRRAAGRGEPRGGT